MCPVSYHSPPAHSEQAQSEHRHTHTLKCSLLATTSGRSPQQVTSWPASCHSLETLSFQRGIQVGRNTSFCDLLPLPLPLLQLLDHSWVSLFFGASWAARVCVCVCIRTMATTHELWPLHKYIYLLPKKNKACLHTQGDSCAVVGFHSFNNTHTLL